MLKTILSLKRAKLLTPKAVYLLLRSLALHGLNIMAILQFAAWRKPGRLAIDDGEQKISYAELLQQSLILAGQLSSQYGIREGDKLALLCRNHVFLVKAIAAVSRLGADCYLISSELSGEQLQDIIDKHDFSLLIADFEQQGKLAKIAKTRIIYVAELSTNEDLANTPIKLKKTRAADIVVFSSGSGGRPKTTQRRPSATKYLSPFLAVLSDLELYKYKTVYIATPIYHGFALAALFISLLLSSSIYLA